MGQARASRRPTSCYQNRGSRGSWFPRCLCSLRYVGGRLSGISRWTLPMRKLSLEMIFLGSFIVTGLLLANGSRRISEYYILGALIGFFTVCRVLIRIRKGRWLSSLEPMWLPYYAAICVVVCLISGETASVSMLGSSPFLATWMFWFWRTTSRSE